MQRSVVRALVFWWGLFVVVQAAERLFLLGTVVRREPPTVALLAKTLFVGFRADLMAATAALAVAAALAGGTALVWVGIARARRRPAPASPWARALVPFAAAIGLLLLLTVTVDMGYYLYSQQRLDFVFFEYLGDLLDQTAASDVAQSQVGRQTGAELGEIGRWALPVAIFAAVMALTIAAWRSVFRRLVDPALARAEQRAPRTTAAALVLAGVAGSVGLHPDGDEAIRRAAISHSTYYTLAQSPLGYAQWVVQRSIEIDEIGAERGLLAMMPEAEALRVSRAVVAPGASFPYPRYPFVREMEPPAVRLPRPANVLLIFVEALDRRYLGLTAQGVRVSPFLDRLRGESVYFERFFANGAQTFPGLFSSLCSYLPPYGSSPMKMRYAGDFLCLPTLLRRAGYRTEMIIGQNRDRNHSRLGLFMARNGLDVLLDENNFPAGARRLGLGMTDDAIFALVRSEVVRLRADGRPFFLTTLTTGTHHPFVVPAEHPEVKRLQADPDRYLAALRFLDLELEKLLVGLERDGLLRDTMVMVLGDHGRHERQGRTEVHQMVGRFMVPLIVWLDPSLRSPSTYRPRTVSTIGSQVDLMPTILALNGATPEAAPFFGRDLSCALVRDCLDDNVAYLNSVYDDLIGLADRDVLWTYSFRTRIVSTIDHALARRAVPRPLTDPAAAARYQQILALYVNANLMLERNRIWGKELGERLRPRVVSSPQARAGASPTGSEGSAR